MGILSCVLQGTGLAGDNKDLSYSILPLGAQLPWITNILQVSLLLSAGLHTPVKAVLGLSLHAVVLGS